MYLDNQDTSLTRQTVPLEGIEGDTTQIKSGQGIMHVHLCLMNSPSCISGSESESSDTYRYGAEAGITLLPSSLKRRIFGHQGRLTEDKICVR